MFSSSPWLRGLVAGLAGAVAWFIGILLFFGLSQGLLTNPGLQSAKFLSIFTTPPLPRTSESPWLLVSALLGIGTLWGWVYVWMGGAWLGAWWQRGLRFAVVGWVLMVPWFEFYLPWNVLWEPTWLAGLEALCWAGVLSGVGLTIAGVDALLRRSARPAA